MWCLQGNNTLGGGGRGERSTKSRLYRPRRLRIDYQRVSKNLIYRALPLGRSKRRANARIVTFPISFRFSLYITKFLSSVEKVNTTGQKQTGKRK